MGKVRMASVRTAWTTVEDGDFFCPECGGDRNYERRTGRRQLTFLGVPLASRGEAPPVVVCSSCLGHFDPEALHQPTTTRLASLLRDAVHAVALSVLAAGGAGSRTARMVAVGWLRESGFSSCDEEQLLTLLAALSADRALEAAEAAGRGDRDGLSEASAESRPVGVVSEPQLREAVGPLAPYLATAGRESLLLHGARIALADGPYQQAELALLDVLGETLDIPAAEVERLLAAAPEPS